MPKHLWRSSSVDYTEKCSNEYQAVMNITVVLNYIIITLLGPLALAETF